MTFKYCRSKWCLCKVDVSANPVCFYWNGTTLPRSYIWWSVISWHLFLVGFDTHVDHVSNVFSLPFLFCGQPQESCTLWMKTLLLFIFNGLKRKAKPKNGIAVLCGRLQLLFHISVSSTRCFLSWCVLFTQLKHYQIWPVSLINYVSTQRSFQRQ